MLDLFVIGIVSRKPILRVGKNDKPFILTKIRVWMQDKSIIANVISFRSDLIEKINNMAEGDPISLSGPANVYIHENFLKEEFVRIDITAHRIYSLI